MTDILSILKEVSNLSGIAVAGLAIILTIAMVKGGYVLKPKGQQEDIDGVSIEEIKPLLGKFLSTLGMVDKKLGLMQGNELVHLQKSLDDLGQKIDARMDNFDDKLAAHDKQAGEILICVKNVWNKCESKL